MTTARNRGVTYIANWVLTVCVIKLKHFFIVCKLTKMFQIADMTVGSRSHMLKTYLQLKMRISLLCLTDGVHIRISEEV